MYIWFNNKIEIKQTKERELFWIYLVNLDEQ